MKRTLTSFTLMLCLTLAAVESFAQRKPSAPAEQGKPAAQKPKTPAAAKPKPAAAAKPADEDALKAELDEVLKLDAASRVERLTAFVTANPDSSQTLRAQELVGSARAALGDEKLRTGDRGAGMELFRAAVKEA